MAIAINDVTYAGEVASQFIVKALSGLDTVKGGHVYVKDGIKKKFTIPRFVVDDMIQERQATPTSGGTATVDAKTIQPQDYMMYFEFNPRDFEDHWQAVNLNPALLDAELPPTVESVLIQESMKFHNNFLERKIWQNTDYVAPTEGSSPDYFNGFVKKMLDDANTIKVTSPVTLTVANIEAKLQATEDAIPASLTYDPAMKFFVSYKTGKLWERAQTAGDFKGINNTQKGVMMFQGRQVVPLAGVPNDTIIAAKGSASLDSNLWLGINSQEDNQIQLARLQANSELFFIKMLFKADVQFGFGEEVVIYTTIVNV